MLMTTIKFPLTLLALSLSLFGFQSDNNQSMRTGDPVKINILKSYPSKTIHLQNIADIEYVPLETKNDVLLDITDIISYVSDKYIVIHRRREGDIFIFNRNGQIFSHFNRMGRGSNEYVQKLSVVFDEKSEEIFVFDLSRILVYSLTGSYKRTLEFASGGTDIAAYNFDNETLLLYDENGVAWNDFMKKPYLFLSKKDGSIVSTLNITFSTRYSGTSVTYMDGSKGTMVGIYPRLQSNPNYGEDFVIGDMSSDTIYSLSKKRELVPMVVRTPSVHATEPRTVWTIKLNTDRFILLYITTLDFGAMQRRETRRSKSMMYEFKSGETSMITFVNDDIPFGNWWPTDNVAMPKNMHANLIDATRLVELYKGKQLRGDFGRLVSTLEEDDNPILMIVKFVSP